MSKPRQDEVTRCPRKKGSAEVPYFAQLGGSALGAYTPQDMLEALLHYRGYERGVVAARPQTAAGTNAKGRNALRPPAAAPPQRESEDGLAQGGSLPPDASLGAKALRPAPALPEAAQHLDIGALVGCLQDALMVGLGLIHQDVRPNRSKVAVARPVFGGRGVFYARGAEVFVAWAAAKDGAVGCYCSCGGDQLKENVGARVRTGTSSSCRHAAALCLALHALAQHLLCASVPELLCLHPDLDGGSIAAMDVGVVPAMQGDDGGAAHVVAYNGILCVVSTPPDAAKKKRPTCRHIPCRTRNMLCVHSVAVKPLAGGYGGFDDDAIGDAGDDVVPGGDAEGTEEHEAIEDEEAKAEGCKGASDDEGTEGDAVSEQGQPAQVPAHPQPLPHGNRGKKGAPRVFADTHRPLRARNLLPCSAETARCASYDALARSLTPPTGHDVKLCEETCIHCGHAVGKLLEGKAAELHTLSGRVRVVTHEGVCGNEKCGKVVPFDGAHLGLFAYSPETVYTRTFLDVILFTIFSNKSSISAASATSAFQLHCTGAIFEGDSAKSRQELGRATDEYSRTLIVPRNLYKCSTCFGCSQTPYAAVVADGQTLGIFRDASYPFDRATRNVPTIPISVDNACSVAAAKVRKCIRSRLKAGFGEEVVFSKADGQAMAKFVGCSGTMPPTGNHDSASHRAETAAWAASCFWSSFFVTSVVPKDPDGVASPPASEPPGSPQNWGRHASPLDPLPSATNRTSPMEKDAPPHRQGGGPAASTSTAPPQDAAFKYCRVISDALGGADLMPIVRRERCPAAQPNQYMP